jgi:hypothetical protein
MLFDLSLQLNDQALLPHPDRDRSLIKALAGCFFEGLQPLIEGGREHDLTFVEDGAFWLKLTKPSCATI